MAATTIAWTQHSWNFLDGCSRVSPGCKHCYAEIIAERFRGSKAFPNGFDLTLHPERLDAPLRMRKPKRIFVNSMSDLFHKDVPDEFIVKGCEIMKKADWHTYQILTKRSERLRAMLRDKLYEYAKLPHIWWGVSVENKKHGLPRIAHLQKTKAAVRWLSIEPLLEDLGVIDLTGIHWVVVGGLSVQRTADVVEMQDSWVLSIKKQCKAAKVPFFFKQHGGLTSRDKDADKLFQGKKYEAYPELIQLGIRR